MPFCEFGNSKHDRTEINIQKKSASWKDRLGQIALHIRYPSSSPIASSPFLLCYIIRCKATAHVRTDDPGSCNTPGGFLVAPPDRSFKPFIFLVTCTRINPIPRVACLSRELLSSWPNFSVHDALSARTIGSSHVNGVHTANLWRFGKTGSCIYRRDAVCILKIFKQLLYITTSYIFYNNKEKWSIYIYIISV